MAYALVRAASALVSTHGSKPKKRLTRRVSARTSAYATLGAKSVHRLHGGPHKAERKRRRLNSLDLSFELSPARVQPVDLFLRSQHLGGFSSEAIKTRTTQTVFTIDEEF